MKKISIISLILIPFLCLAHDNESSWENSPYFDTTFLSNYDEVRTSLCKEGFKEVCIPTEDGLNLNGLLLERPEATLSVIVCCGFYPGRKEGMASLYPMLPHTCNILFFDARGHGTSEGKFWSAIHRYGKDEYRDVIAAIDYMHKHVQKPILIHSICVGAFHAARALIELQKKDLIANYALQGLIFDSGVASIVESAEIPRKHLQHKIIPGIVTSTMYKNDSKKEAKERYIYKIAWFMSAKILRSIEFCVKPFLRWHETETNLQDKMCTIPCPVLYIHAKNDSYASCETIISLAAKTQRAHCWWIENSEHAANHLKHKQEYRIRLCDFIGQILSS